MIADTADAMTTDRPYRAAMTFEALAAELSEYSNTQFDAELVEAFSKCQAIRDLVDPIPVALAVPQGKGQGRPKVFAVR